MLAGEELELLKHGYHKYFLVGYDCPKCGSCRSEQAFPPDRRINCPRCQTHCPAHLLMTGFTRRELALCEVWAAPINTSKIRRYLPEDASAVFLAPKPTRKAALSPGQRLTAAR